MYLPSKFNSKYLALLALILLLIVLPLREPIQNIVFLLSKNLSFNAIGRSNKIEELTAKVAQFAIENRRLQYLQEDNERLRKALNFKSEHKIELIGAEVITFAPSNWRRMVMINRGSRDGITEGMHALDEEGWLIGKIVEVQKEFARVILITDPSFTLPVFVGETGFGLLKGRLGGIQIQYIENGEQINVNDKIWCKIPALNFPIYVGEVKKIILSNDSLFEDIDVTLYSQSALIHKIFIVK